jgi:hypothetical protein
MNTVGFPPMTTDRDMFHESSSRQRLLLPEPRLRSNHLAAPVP